MTVRSYEGTTTVRSYAGLLTSAHIIRIVLVRSECCTVADCPQVLHGLGMQAYMQLVSGVRCESVRA